MTEWLTVPIAEVKGTRLTPERLINEVATMGPAHYSEHISAQMLEMQSLSLGGVPGYFRTRFTFAKVLVELGKKFLETN